LPDEQPAGNVEAPLAAGEPPPALHPSHHARYAAVRGAALQRMDGMMPRPLPAGDDAVPIEDEKRSSPQTRTVPVQDRDVDEMLDLYHDTFHETIQQSYEIIGCLCEPPRLKAARHLVLAFGAVTGAAWMRAVHASAETIIVGSRVFSASMLCSQFLLLGMLCCAILPAWFLYIVPWACKTAHEHRRCRELEVLQTQWASKRSLSGVGYNSLLKSSEYLSDTELVDAVAMLTKRRAFLNPLLEAKGIGQSQISSRKRFKVMD
jgi:hypothetical protein